MMNEKKDIIVYGSFNDVYVNFLKKDVAEYYAEMWQSHKEGITFGELHKRDPWLLNFIVEHKGDQLGASVPDAEEHDCDEYFDLLFEEFIKADLFIEADFDEYRELDISDFRRIYENEYDRSERFPIKSDMFNEDYIYGFDLLEMLNYEPSMNWVPSEIREKCGEIHNTVLDGEVLHFDIANTDKIVVAFEAMGYKCVRDELLVAKAYGQA